MNHDLIYFALYKVFSFATVVACAVHGELIGQPRYGGSDTANGSEQEGRVGKQN